MSQSERKHKKYNHRKAKAKLTVWLIVRSLVLGFFGICAALLIGAVVVALYYNQTLPDYRNLEERMAPESSKIYSRDGTLLYEFHGEVKRTRVSRSDIDQDLQHATVAIEDKDYYNHGAISMWGILRAIVANYKEGEVTQGGSTITQQLVKNALLSRDRSFGRKLGEIILAYKIESHYDKDQILELYLNEIPYGRNAYGAEAAALAYFNKSAKDLSLAESAYLAALPQAPSYYSPTGDHPEALEARKEKVLTVMLEQKYITQEQFNQAKEEKVEFKPLKTSIIAPHFVSWIQNILTEKYGRQFLEEGGLKVYTTLDLHLQGIAERVVREGVAENAKKYNAYNGALVAVEPSSGKVLAMVGSKDYFAAPEPAGCKPGVSCKFEPNVNVAVAERQPGSSFKPYAYVTAFKPEFGYSPTSRLLDVPTAFGTAGGRPYIPQNYDGGARGWVTIRKALAGSLNIPAVRIVAAVGVSSVVDTARSLGITSPLQNCGLSLVLGGCEVRLVDHVGGFAAIGNMGVYNGTTPFLKVEDKHGNILEEYKAKNEQAVNPEAAYQLISIMTDDQSRQYIFGKDNPLNLPDRPVACKTGTTQNWKDGWTLCFTPQLAAGVWVGNNNGSLMKAGADGVFTAAPLWRKFMEEAMAGMPVQDWPMPEGIVPVRVDSSNRPIITKIARGGRVEYYAWYALPKELQVAAVPRAISDRLGKPISGAPTGSLPAEQEVPQFRSPSDKNVTLPP
jgi:1A family penicillin-binding protein